MQIHENFNMDNTTSFSNRTGYNVKLSTILIVVAIFICSIIGASLLVYNFAACPEDLPLKSSLYPDHHYHVSQTITTLTNVTTITDVEGDTKTKNSTTQLMSSLPEPTIDVRLPRSIVPVAYDLKVIPYLVEGKFTFDGDVKIYARVVADCRNVTLHSFGLKIYDKDVTVKLTSHNFSNATISKQYFIEVKQFYVIVLTETLLKGQEIEIHIRYLGILNDYLQGFYRSSYYVGNETR